MLKINWPWAKPKDNYWYLAGFIAVSQAAGLLGTIFTLDAIPTWYRFLNKPFFSPPNWVFGPVWTILYTAMGVSAYVIWRKYQFGGKARVFWQMFTIQLVLNTLWTPLFFGLKWLEVAFIEIVVMWYYIWQTIRAGTRLIPVSGYLLYPYLAWVTFATMLNLAIAMLN